MRLRGDSPCCGCPQFASDSFSKLLLKWPCPFLVLVSSFPTESSAGVEDVYFSTGLGMRDQNRKFSCLITPQRETVDFPLLCFFFL